MREKVVQKLYKNGCTNIISLFLKPPGNQSYKSGNQYFSNATKWVSLLAWLVRRIKNQSNNIQIKKWES